MGNTAAPVLQPEASSKTLLAIPNSKRKHQPTEKAYGLTNMEPLAQHIIQYHRFDSYFQRFFKEKKPHKFTPVLFNK